MKTTEEMMAVMTAYKEGKIIESKYVHEHNTVTWAAAPMPCWDWSNYDYRVKPEPKYRPYKDAEECFADVKKHGGWAKGINEVGYYYILSVVANGIETCTLSPSYEFMLKMFVWADDLTPCGVLEEE